MADYSSDRYEITIVADRIFKVKPFEGIEFGVNDVIEMRAIYLKFSEGKSFAILLDASNDFTPTDEARALLATKEYAEKRIAAAFVTTTLANKIFGNFFIQFNKPASPTKLFVYERFALDWLKKQMVGK